MRKFYGIIGILVGIAILVFAVNVFNYEVDLKNPSMSRISLPSITEPSKVDYEWYGGDAYTGIQQAAAQTANNLVPVFQVMEAGNTAVDKLNDNLSASAKQEVENTKALISAVQYFLGFLLLAVGLMTIVKYLGVFFPEKKQLSAPEVPILS